jgi:malate synthase
MYTDAVTTADGAPIPEHFLDAMVTAACALHDLNGKGAGTHAANSRTGSMYVVKPKMHGPEEVELAADLFSHVEDILSMPRNTIKMGVMDEERRTSTNLHAALAPAASRLVFVNTGFLDRTADEIHTSMKAGPMLPKADLKKAPWYLAYEASNVDTCIATSLIGKGQIGKGMWAEPEEMSLMMQTKGAQLEAGASTAWVPSPTAATLHAIHYLRTNVASIHASLEDTLDIATRQAASRDQMLRPPVMAYKRAEWRGDKVQAELEDNAQGLLGYVVRWVGQGVGCSKVPNMAGAQLMEDRATLRISSQLIANWLHHGVVSEAQVVRTLKSVAKLVDEQNAGQPGYRSLSPAYDGPEWHAALELVFEGVDAPNGYTEPSLTKWRRARKALEAYQLSASTASSTELTDAAAEKAVIGDVEAYAAWAGKRGQRADSKSVKLQLVSKPEGTYYVRRGDSMSGAA